MSEELRILDANFNRAREGLRVVEEYARFICNSSALSRRIKNMRHRLAELCESLTNANSGSLLSSRNTLGDVGTVITTTRENNRQSAQEVASASCKRLTESLRVLEEYSKIDFGEAAVQFEKLRYQSYELEADLFTDQRRREQLDKAKLYVLVTDSLAAVDSLTAVREAVAGGADIIQLREKQLEDQAFYERAVEAQEVCRKAGVLLIINDRPHLVKLVQADGVHTGQGDLVPALTRTIIGRECLIGKSTHSPEDLDNAYKAGADYVGVGPVFKTMTKEHRYAVGLEYVRYAATHAKLPYFCIGSINRETISSVLAAGARAVAVCTAIIAASDIATETAWFKEQLT